MPDIREPAPIKPTWPTRPERHEKRRKRNGRVKPEDANGQERGKRHSDRRLRIDDFA